MVRQVYILYWVTETRRKAFHVMIEEHSSVGVAIISASFRCDSDEFDYAS